MEQEVKGLQSEIARLKLKRGRLRKGRRLRVTATEAATPVGVFPSLRLPDEFDDG
jgi:hypothetical protein